MKAFALVVLSLILVMESTNAFPQSRMRRDAQKDDLKLSPEAAEKREELSEYVSGELIRVAKNSVDNQKKLFEKVLKGAEEADLKTDALKEHLQKFTDIVDRANALTEINDETEEKLFNLFGSGDLAIKYDEIENPTEEEKLIKNLLEEHDKHSMILKMFFDVMQLRSNLIKHIQEYLDSLSEEDKLKEAQLIEWLTKLKNAKGFGNYINDTMKIFNYLGKNDSDEKKE